MPDPSSPQDVSVPPTPSPEPLPQPLPVEETPEIPMPPPAEAPVNATPPPKSGGSFVSTVGLLILFVGLFGLGVWLSSYVRKYFPNGLVGITPQQQEVVNAPTPTPTPVDPFATWKTYQVVSGATKLPIAGWSYKLPGDVLAPICDTTTCMSQGTYLPGGSRFTIAPRGEGQLLLDFRGGVITDVGGMVFTTTDATVSGHTATQFTGVFAGKTVGGYGFTQMRGYMVQVTDSLSLEVNHFTPTGVTADFTADDALFDKILTTLTFSGSQPIATETPAPATTSGY